MVGIWSWCKVVGNCRYSEHVTVKYSCLIVFVDYDLVNSVGEIHTVERNARFDRPDGIRVVYNKTESTHIVMGVSEFEAVLFVS